MLGMGQVNKRINLLLVVIGFFMFGLPVTGHTAVESLRFKPIPTQFIAALGEPDSSSGTGAQNWGIWHRDPGPRGVWLNDFAELQIAEGLAPSNWQFDSGDWWLDENGLLMEKPQFPISPGRYVVTGEREVTTVLRVHAPDKNGDQKWELQNGARLYDVTHLPCRSARYTDLTGNPACSPDSVTHKKFPILPGDPMPAVNGCHKLDYSVLFVIGMLVEN